jgi:hypothetical protein
MKNFIPIVVACAFVVLILSTIHFGRDHSFVRVKKNNAVVSTKEFDAAKKRNAEQKNDRSNLNTDSLQHSSWFDTVMKNIEAEEYEFALNTKTNQYISPNRKQNLLFTYSNNGFSVKPLMTKIPLFNTADHSIKESEKKYRCVDDWTIGMTLEGYGRDGNIVSFLGKNLTAGKRHASSTDGTLSIQYDNSEKGMRQDFAVNEKPAGDGNLKLLLHVNSELQFNTSGDGLAFHNDKNTVEMYYNELKIYDAHGNTIEGTFEKVADASIEICVNDNAAAYPITIDPLSNSASWTKAGESSGNQFGYSVATAGDVNGDGYSDVIVGAPFYSSSKGKAYVFYGSSTGLSTTASWTQIGETNSDEFGYSVSTAGDVNGDGYSDVIVGAFNYTSGSTNQGKAYVYYGGSTGLDTIASWTNLGAHSGDYFGRSVATAGDINGDGYSDVIVGADGYSSNKGLAYVFQGSSGGLSTSASWAKTGENNTDEFGYSVSTAGDVNGDGYSDIIIGAYGYSSFAGKAYVYNGSSSGVSTTASWSQVGENSSDEFGFSVSTAGDVNGDGFSDIIVGAFYYIYPHVKGKAYVYNGSSSGLITTASWTKTGGSNYDNFGYSVATAGDVNGDGYSDIIVGTPGYSNGTGAVFVFNGSSTGLSTTASYTKLGEATYDNFGSTVATAGDINGDGYSDILVGDPGAPYPSLYGKAYVFIGSAAGLSSSSSWTKNGENSGDSFGLSVALAGDVNGDGYSDVIVGAPGYSSSTGKVYVFNGSSTGLSTTASWTTIGENSGDTYGQSVSTAGDVNGDGYSDVIVGAPGFSNVAGKAYVFQGSATGLSATTSWAQVGENSYDNYGYSVSTAGDVNGDGYSDVIVGAVNYIYPSGKGKAYVYNGGASGVSASASWSVIGEHNGDNFGWSVATTGDVNGDGFSDIIVGAYGNSTYAGKAYVFNGSAAGLSATASWTKTGENSNDYFGYCIATAGDVNGDGYSDVIVGAYGYSSSAGKAYLFNGSSSGLSTTASWTKTGENSGDEFSSSLSTAGDVNGDGYSDIIVGAYWYSSRTGKAYVYHGNASGLDTSASWTQVGENSLDYFGHCVAAAGDVNGDGYSDVIVGAKTYPSLNSYGKAYVYYGNASGGLRTVVQQYQPSSSTVIGPNGSTTMDGSVRLSGYAKSPFGRTKGTLVYEYVPVGTPFSGQFSTSSSGSQNSFTDLDTSGKQLNADVSSIPSNAAYNWRVRTRYDLVCNPFQKFGPWKYYNNYQPLAFGSFKSQTTPLPVELVSFTALSWRLNAELKWTTATEVENAGFEIERKTITNKQLTINNGASRQSSIDNTQWTRVGFVSGAGTTNSPKEYSFTDGNLSAGRYAYRLKQIDRDGTFKYSQEVELVVGTTPRVFTLSQNYPNPFNPTTTIEFTLPDDGKVSLKIYDVLGREVETLVSEEMKAGEYHQAVFNGVSLASGIYFARLQYGSKQLMKKMLLLK